MARTRPTDWPDISSTNIGLALGLVIGPSPLAAPPSGTEPQQGIQRDHEYRNDLRSSKIHDQVFFTSTHRRLRPDEPTMDFSGQELEHLQRAAGLLGLTVDELIQHGRRPPPSPATPVPARHHQHHITSPGAFYQAFSPRQSQVIDFSPPGGLGDQGLLGVDSPWRTSPAAPAASFSHLPAVPQQSLSTEVILLNPQTAWYDCNMDFTDFVGDLSDGTSSADPGSSSDSLGLGQGSFVHVTPAADSDADSESTAREEGDDVVMGDSGADWNVVSPPSVSSASTGTSVAGGSRKQRFKSIAPRPGSTVSSLSSRASSSSHKVRKRRSPYEQSSKDDTNLTRQLNACVRCRMQRNRVSAAVASGDVTETYMWQCIPDPTNPRGPCKTCQQKTVRMSRLPCLRYKITDSTLFRTGLDYMPFYKKHPMTGPTYGDFHLYGEVQWTGAPSRFLSLGQLGGAHFQIELEEFTPTRDLLDVDLKGRPIFSVPWAISDPDAAVVALNQYIDDNIGAYLETYLDDSDPVVWDIFHAAYRASVFPAPVPLLAQTIRLWCVCRFIESRWRCWGDDQIRAANPQDPFYDWDSPPPYLDYQLASIIIHRVLGPLRDEVLRDLQNVVNEHRPQDWYITFLCSFILLQNYEIQMRFQEQFATRRNAPVRQASPWQRAVLTPLGSFLGYAARPSDQFRGKDHPSPFPLLLQGPEAVWA